MRQPAVRSCFLVLAFCLSANDKDGLPGFYDRTQVKILGFRRITPVPPR